MTHNCKLFVLRIVTQSYNCLLKIIISYLKLYNCVQTNDLFNKTVQLAGAVKYTDCIYAEGKTPPSITVHDMTLNYLMARLNPWRFG